mgnify:CR=1 FL=1
MNELAVQRELDSHSRRLDDHGKAIDSLMEWRAQVKGDLMRLAERLDPVEKAVVTIDVHWRGRRRHDPDNALAGLKGCLDALVERGWIVDDDADHVELVIRGHTGSDSDHVVFRVEAA